MSNSIEFAYDSLQKYFYVYNPFLPAAQPHRFVRKLSTVCKKKKREKKKRKGKDSVIAPLTIFV